MAETREITTQEKSEFVDLRKDLHEYSGKFKQYPEAFLAYYKDNFPEDYTALDSILDGVSTDADSTEVLVDAIQNLDYQLSQYQLEQQRGTLVQMLNESGFVAKDCKIVIKGSQVSISVPCAGDYLNLTCLDTSISGEKWQLDGVSYLTPSMNVKWGGLEEVLEDAKIISTALDRVEKGELKSSSDTPFSITEVGLLEFDGATLHNVFENTFEADDYVHLAANINARYRALMSSAPQTVSPDAEDVPAGTETTAENLTSADINKFASEQGLPDLKEGKGRDNFHEIVRTVSTNGGSWLKNNGKFSVEISKIGDRLQVRLSSSTEQRNPAENRLFDAYRKAVVTEFSEYTGMTSQVVPKGKHETIITVPEILPFMTRGDFVKSEAYNPNQTPDKKHGDPGYVDQLKDGYSWVSDKDGNNYAFEKVDEPTTTVETASEAPVDYRADARTNPKKYLTESTSNTSTFTPPNREAEMAIRIQDLYEKDAEKPKLSSTRYPGLTFAYGSGKDGNSWYDVAGSGKRLAILSGDRFTEVKAEVAPAAPAAPAVAVAVAVAEPVAPVTPVKTPDIAKEEVAPMTQVELRSAALTLKNDRKVLTTVLPARRAEWEAKKGKLFANEAMIAEEIAKIDADRGRYARSVEVLTAQLSEQKDNPDYAVVINEVFDDSTRLALELDPTESSV